LAANKAVFKTISTIEGIGDRKEATEIARLDNDGRNEMQVWTLQYCTEQ